MDLILGSFADVTSTSYSYSGSGLLSLGGSGDAASSQHSYVASGGLLIGNSSTSTINLPYDSEGLLSLNQETTTNFIAYHSAIGGITLAGAVSFLFDSVIEKSFTWAIGEGVLRNYRVEGKCQPADHPCPPTHQTDPNCTAGTMQYIVTVQARSLSDLCERLTERGLTGPIKKIQIWSLPAHQADYPEGADPSCNTLETVSFDDIPECLDFTIDANITVTAGVSAIAIVVENYSYIASGKVGFSEILSDVSTGQYSYDASGNLTTGNQADFTSPQFLLYEASGGFSVGIETSYYNSDFGIVSAISSVAAEVLDFAIKYAIVEVSPLTPNTDRISVNCCTEYNLPQVLFIRHELTRSEKLFNFLRINGYTLPSILRLIYSDHKKTWNADMHYKGKSVVQGQQESWDIILEFGCLTADPRIDISNSWSFALSVRSKNLGNSKLENTRLIVKFDPDDVCGNSGLLDFSFDLNARTGITIPSFLKTLILTDGIGMFKGPSFSRVPLSNFAFSSFLPESRSGLHDQSKPLRKILLGV